jgi:hypothetical protein
MMFERIPCDTTFIFYAKPSKSYRGPEATKQSIRSDGRASMGGQGLARREIADTEIHLFCTVRRLPVCIPVLHGSSLFIYRGLTACELWMARVLLAK